MTNEPVRMWADWLAGKVLDFQGIDQGVNAKINDMRTLGLLDPADELPPQVVAVVDPTRDPIRTSEGGITLPELPIEFPAILVTMDAPATAEGEVMTNSGPNNNQRRTDRFQMAARYIVPDHEAHSARQNAGYTIRAIVRSTRQWLKNENEAARTRNLVCVGPALALTYGLTNEEIGSARSTAAVVLTVTVFDFAP